MMSEEYSIYEPDKEYDEELAKTVAETVGSETNVTPDVSEGVEDGNEEARRAFYVLAIICVVLFLMGIIYYIL